MVILGISDEPAAVDFLAAIMGEVDILLAYYATSLEFDAALGMMGKGSLEVKPFITKSIPLEGVMKGFKELQDHNNRQVKVLVYP